jgi:uncharacterized protein (DUF433 family)
MNGSTPSTDGETSLMLFSADQVSRLTGLSKRRLAYWARTDFYLAEHGGATARVPYGRVYSFLDLVALRTIAILVNKHAIHLSEMRRVAAELSDRRGDWAGFTFYVRDRRVYWQRAGESERYGTRQPGQAEMPIEMDRITRQAIAIVSRVRKRSASDIGKIVRNRFVAQRRWTIAGTRIGTEAIWYFHEQGYTPDAIIDQYPRLTVGDVEAAIRFESDRRRKVS